MTNDVWSSLQTYANSLSIDSTLYTIDTNFDRVEVIFTIELIPPQKSMASANQQKPSAVLGVAAQFTNKTICTISWKERLHKWKSPPQIIWKKQ